MASQAQTIPVRVYRGEQALVLLEYACAPH
jgi:hypothetical protein